MNSDKNGSDKNSEVSLNGQNKKISIITPSLNRSEFLIRALRYYIKTGFKGYICIGDSSDTYHAEKTNDFIKTVKDQLNIIYQYFPKTVDVGLVFKELVFGAPTPYSVYAGDDDLLIPRSLEKCAQFLEGHPEYIAAHGLRIAYKLKTGGEFGQIDHIRYARQHIWESDKASERWAGYVRDAASTQYYVHRKETWQRMYRDINSVPDRYLGPEFLPCSLTAISGKVKQLDCLATVFQIQYKDNKPFGWDTTSLFDLATHPNWSVSVQGLRKSIVEALMEQDGISEKEANEIFDREFWWHVKSFFAWQYQKKYGNLQPGHAELAFNIANSCESVYALITYPNWSQFILSTRDNTIKVLAERKGVDVNKARDIFDRELWFYLLAHLNRQYQEKYGIEQPRTDVGHNPAYDYNKLLSLEMLLNPSSPFHKDFMPVYEIITGGMSG